MKTYSMLILSVALVCLASSPAIAQNGSKAGFEKIKSLSGEWDGVKSDGQKVGLSYEVTSGGSAVVETLMPVNEPHMVTVYYMDGDRLMMTHFCSAGNQPRMAAEPSSSRINQIDFNLQDVTNVTDASPGHMQSLRLKFEKSGELTQVWTFNSREQGPTPATFTFSRKN